MQMLLVDRNSYFHEIRAGTNTRIPGNCIRNDQVGLRLNTLNFIVLEIFNFIGCIIYNLSSPAIPNESIAKAFFFLGPRHVSNIRRCQEIKGSCYIYQKGQKNKIEIKFRNICTATTTTTKP